MGNVLKIPYDDAMFDHIIILKWEGKLMSNNMAGPQIRRHIRETFNFIGIKLCWPNMD